MKKCRICYSTLKKELINLGMSPIANSFIPFKKNNQAETYFPLKVLICNTCYLAQLDESEKPENIFNNNYAYLSSYSNSWLDHSKKYAEEVIKKYNLTASSHVVEIASNDGYMLQYFLKHNIKVTGIEPATNCAEAARKKNIYTENLFFTKANASFIVKKHGKANLMIANNVLAHVPNMHDFISGFKIMLSKEGVITFEFPHLLQLIKNNQFDTIYHEHYSYLSLKPLIDLFNKHQLRVFDVKNLNTHGGSLRIYVCHTKAKHLDNTNIVNVLNKETAFGLWKESTYKNFRNQVLLIKENTIKFFMETRKKNQVIVGYGAPAKGNTFLNYCGIGKDYIQFTVDKSKTKQNTFLPGTRIPVYDIDKLKTVKPDYIFILPWNIKEEIASQIRNNYDYPVKFVTAIPKLKIFK